MTYDGLTFECNFLGEAVWTRCGVFAVHVFTEQASNGTQATVIKGVAVQAASLHLLSFYW